MKVFLHWIKQSLNHTKVIEGALVILSLWWAFILALPLDTFSTSSAYQAMQGIANEEVWSAVFLVVSGCSLYGMIFEDKRLHMSGLLLSAFLWIFVSTMFALSNLATTATGTYFVIACLNAFVYFKVGEHYGS